MEPRPEKEDPSPTRPGGGGDDLSPEERDLWISDDEIEDAHIPDPNMTSSGSTPSEGEEDLSPDDEGFPDDDEEALPGESGAESQAQERAPAGTPPATEPPSSILPHFSRTDLVWLGALGVVLLLIAALALSLFFGDINTTTPDKVRFPAKGKNLVIRKIETFWRKPDRDHDVGVRMEAILIPAAEITLKSSESGALRFFFENPDGDRVGDSVSLAFSGGAFEATGGESANINATNGFEDIGNYNDYLTEKVRFWYLVVLEGPGLGAPGNAFEEIVRMRITPKRR